MGGASLGWSAGYPGHMASAGDFHTLLRNQPDEKNTTDRTSQIDRLLYV